MRETSIPITIHADITVKLFDRTALNELKTLPGVEIKQAFPGTTADNFAYDILLKVNGKYGLQALEKIHGLKFTSADICLPYKGNSRDMVQEMRIRLGGLEEALKGENNLEGLVKTKKISKETFEEAEWMSQKLTRLLRGV